MSRRPWFSIGWFASWGLFQSYAVAAVMAGTWERPEAFPEEAYTALIYPDMAVIPIYLAASVLLFLRRPAGIVLGLVACGAIIYAMVYLFALSGLSGLENLTADGVFLIVTIATLVQLWRRVSRA